MSTTDEMVRDILAHRELASRLAAHDAHQGTEEQALYLLRHGPPYAAHPAYPHVPDEDMAAIAEKAKAEIEFGRRLADAWLRVRTLDLAALRAAGGAQLPEPGESPSTERTPRVGDRRRSLGLRDDEPAEGWPTDERPPIELDAATVEAAAIEHGLFVTTEGLDE